MQSAEIILNIISKKSQENQELERIYRLLYNRELYLKAYQNIYANDGAMTKGITEETVDGMSMKKIDQIIELVRKEQYRWTPVRRIYIPKKKSGKLRPLGIPSWSDKLLQEVIRLILEAYYEPQFSEYSHGFRRNRGCHTALDSISKKEGWSSVKWFVEGDIENCFGDLNIEVMLSILSEKIKDNRFLNLIKYLMRSGYVENWQYHKTLSGCPQGSVIGPILANIYMDRLDKYIEDSIIPEYSKGKKRKANKEYEKIGRRMRKAKKNKDWKNYKCLRKQLQTMPSKDNYDPDFKRIYYVRYCDDWLLGLSGSKEDAEIIKEKIRIFLREKLKLNLSEEKTLITHARQEKARFLGYDIHVYHNNTKHDHRGQRCINSGIGLRIPAEKLRDKIREYSRKGKSIHRPERVHISDYHIIAQYQLELRGFVQYYLLAYNAHMLEQVRWRMETSLLKTLACKYKSSVAKMYKKYKAELQTEAGKRKVIQVQIQRKGKQPLLAYFGGISLKRQKNAKMKDSPTQIYHGLGSLIERLLKDTCELCGAQGHIEMHHVRKLKDLSKKRTKPDWMKKMIRIRRKTLAVCSDCHKKIHSGKYDQRKLK